MSATAQEEETLTPYGEWDALDDAAQWEAFHVREELIECLRGRVAGLNGELAAALKETRCGWETAKAADKELKKMMEQRNALHAELAAVKAERDMLRGVIAGETHLDVLTGEYARQATAAAEKAQRERDEAYALVRRLFRAVRDLLAEGIAKNELMKKALNEHSP